MLFLTATVAYSGQTLTRPRAEAILKAYEPFARARNYPLELAMGTAIEGGWQAKAYYILKEEGYIQITKNSNGKSDVAVTARVTNEKWKVGTGTTVFPTLSVPTAVPRIIEINGISTEGTEAIVEFTYKWELTPIGKKLTDAGVQLGGIAEMPTGISTTKVSREQAQFKLYDDGWRVVHTSDELNIRI